MRASSRRKFLMQSAVLAGSTAISCTPSLQLLKEKKDTLKGFGYSLFAWYNTPFHEDYNELSRFLSDINVKHLSISLPLFQENRYSTKIGKVGRNSKHSPDSSHIAQVIDFARNNNLEVLLRPYVMLSTEEWQGEIKPKNVKEWFKNYSDYLAKYASLAQTNKDIIKKFSVGVEFRSIQKYTEEWLSAIKIVRHFFDYEITYCANFDSYEKVDFWDSLDFIGIDSYFPMPSNKFNKMVSKWKKIGARLEDFSRLHNKRIEFTEFGCKSVKNASLRPYNYLYKNELCEDEQFKYYKSLIDANLPIDLAYIWDLDGPDNPASTGYSIQGKKVESLIRDFNKKK